MSVDHEPEGEAVLANGRGEETVRGADGNYQEGGRQRDGGGGAVDSPEDVRSLPLTPAPDPPRNASDNRCKILESHTHHRRSKRRRGEREKRGNEEKRKWRRGRKREKWRVGSEKRNRGSTLTRPPIL